MDKTNPRIPEIINPNDTFQYDNDFKEKGYGTKEEYVAHVRQVGLSVAQLLELAGDASGLRIDSGVLRSEPKGVAMVLDRERGEIEISLGERRLGFDFLHGIGWRIMPLHMFFTHKADLEKIEAIVSEINERKLYAVQPGLRNNYENQIE